MVKVSRALRLKQFHSSREKAALSAHCHLNLEVTSHLSQLLVMVQRIAAERLMICRGNLYSRFWFLKQVPRHLVRFLPSLRTRVRIKGTNGRWHVRQRPREDWCNFDWTAGIGERTLCTVGVLGHRVMALVQTKSSRGQCCVLLRRWNFDTLGGS